LRGSRRPGGRIEGRLRDFGNWAESGHGPKRRMRKRKETKFLLIFRILFREKNNLEVARYFIKCTKNILKIPKILGKFPETEWEMNNPNKVFGASEKDFRAF
jgi:hypothetical protein